jgi:hypothetical protein
MFYSFLVGHAGFLTGCGFDALITGLSTIIGMRGRPMGTMTALIAFRTPLQNRQAIFIPHQQAEAGAGAKALKTPTASEGTAQTLGTISPNTPVRSHNPNGCTPK